MSSKLAGGPGVNDGYLLFIGLIIIVFVTQTVRFLLAV